MLSASVPQPPPPSPDPPAASPVPARAPSPGLRVSLLAPSAEGRSASPPPPPPAPPASAPGSLDAVLARRRSIADAPVEPPRCSKRSSADPSSSAEPTERQSKRRSLELQLPARVERRITFSELRELASSYASELLCPKAANLAHSSFDATLSDLVHEPVAPSHGPSTEP